MQGAAEGIQWTEEFSVGSQFLDMQNRKLAKILNTVIQHETTGLDAVTVTDMLSDMTEYIDSHFAFEELHMKQMQYPELDAHKKKHRQFMLDVARLAVSAMNHVPSVPDRIRHLVSDWLTNHVLTFDRQYKLFLQNAG